MSDGPDVFMEPRRGFGYVARMLPLQRLVSTGFCGNSPLSGLPEKADRPRRHWLALGLLGVALGLGCGSTPPPEPAGVMALHTLPGGTASGAQTDFFALPFPNDLRLLSAQKTPTSP